MFHEKSPTTFKADHELLRFLTPDFCVVVCGGEASLPSVRRATGQGGEKAAATVVMNAAAAMAVAAETVAP